MHTIPVAHTGSLASMLVHPLKTLSTALGAWKVRRRHRADLALLMSMDRHMLNDIGVVLAEPQGPSAVLRWHPAVLATTLESSGPQGSSTH